MKNYFFIFLFTIILLITSLVYSTHTRINASEKDQKVSSLRRDVQHIKSISPQDTNFSDLLFLKEVLKEKQIVLLGEAMHTDGITFLAKSRLVKFLHQELGFDVLMYEAGLYDTELFWQKAKRDTAKNDSIFSSALWRFWQNNSENKNLLSYLLKNINTTKEISVAGFDVQFSGQVKNIVRDSLLSSYLANHRVINKQNFPSFFKVKPNYSEFPLPHIFYTLKKTFKDSVLSDIEGICHYLKKRESQNKNDMLYLRFFSNLHALYTYSWKYDYGSLKRFQVRDSAMASNFTWLKENRFKGRKIIIWAANMHIGYDNRSYTHPVGFTSMGEYIKKSYGKQCYAINFTSFSNTRSVGNSDEVYNNKTVEFLLHKLKQPYLFLNFSSIRYSTFMFSRVNMNCNNSQSMNARWCNITDGIFYIDRMSDIKENQ